MSRFSCEDSDGADCGHEREEAHHWNHCVDVRNSASTIRGATCDFVFRGGIMLPKGLGRGRVKRERLGFDMLRTLAGLLKEHPIRTKLFNKKQDEKGSAHSSLFLVVKETLVRLKVLSAGEHYNLKES
ncbi:hypothetical protein LR48_Vigan10g087600 [Vigna angularis]|uniref:Uncharacterized protein n=1 Tax=Phaseolus angularis TaxID=3914 RepID=A0A0L9VJW1_PHAAN|nr:hypothetical protein LR48_Vigan10g087600 [Vigna angularis]